MILTFWILEWCFQSTLHYNELCRCDATLTPFPFAIFPAKWSCAVSWLLCWWSCSGWSAMYLLFIFFSDRYELEFFIFVKFLWQSCKAFGWHFYSIMGFRSIYTWIVDTIVLLFYCSVYVNKCIVCSHEQPQFGNSKCKMQMLITLVNCFRQTTYVQFSNFMRL